MKGNGMRSRLWLAAGVAGLLAAAGCAGEDGLQGTTPDVAAIDVGVDGAQPSGAPGVDRAMAAVTAASQGRGDLVRPSPGDPSQAAMLDPLRPAPWLDPSRPLEAGVERRLRSAPIVPSPQADPHFHKRNYHLAWVRVGLLREGKDGEEHWVRATFQPNPRPGADDYWTLVGTEVQPQP